MQFMHNLLFITILKTYSVQLQCIQIKSCRYFFIFALFFNIKLFTLQGLLLLATKLLFLNIKPHLFTHQGLLLLATKLLFLNIKPHLFTHQDLLLLATNMLGGGGGICFATNLAESCTLYFCRKSIILSANKFSFFKYRI